MITFKDITFQEEIGIEYTNTRYKNATEFYYNVYHKPSKQLLEKKILYGVSKANGLKLIEHWNTKLPAVWKYWPHKEKAVSFSITFKNGDFRNLHLTIKELAEDLRFMRNKWTGIECIVSSFDKNRQPINRKNFKL